MFELIPFDRGIRSVMGFDPFRDFDEMEKRFFGGRDTVSAFRTDVTDTGDAFKLEAELPGFDKQDIKLDVEDDCLTISAQHSSETKDEKHKVVKRERYFGAYSRSFDVSGIDVDGIQASYDKGVLTLMLPKKQETLPAKRTLEIQ